MSKKHNSNNVNDECKFHTYRDSITEEDELILNILSRKIQLHTTATNECRISNMNGFCRTCREDLSNLIHSYSFIHSYGIDKYIEAISSFGHDGNELTKTDYLYTIVKWYKDVMTQGKFLENPLFESQIFDEISEIIDDEEHTEEDEDVTVDDVASVLNLPTDKEEEKNDRT